METIRLRSIQKPNQAEELIESCVRGRKIVPQDATRMTTLSELSIPLRRLARTSSSGHSPVWLAWTDGASVWFVTGVSSLALSRERGRPVLQLLVYNQNGALKEALTCVQTAARSWENCA
jgi:hypothetical protein